MALSTRRNKLSPKLVTIERRPLRRYFGYCVPDTGKIVIRSSLRGRPRLGTEIHELIHVILPEMSEKGVQEITYMLVYHLWRLGYRLDESKAAR